MMFCSSAPMPLPLLYEPFSSALQPVSCVSDIGCIITAERHAAEQPEIPSDRSPQQRRILTNKGEQQHRERAGALLHLVMTVWRSTACSFCFNSSGSFLFRAVCLQVSRDLSLCLRVQRSVQRTQGLSSREGSFCSESLLHYFLWDSLWEMKCTQDIIFHKAMFNKVLKIPQ